MQHLFEVWKDFASAARDASHILLLADYDGTLTPITGRPADATLSEKTRRRLQELVGNPAFSVGVISGRSLDDVRSMVRIDGIYYSGNHGLEIEGPGLLYCHPPALPARATMTELGAQLAAALKDIPGAIMQEKGLSLSVHYRLVEDKDLAAVEDIFRRLTGPFLKQNKIIVFYGKKVLEVKPPLDWDKGKAVGIIIREIKKTLDTKQLLFVFLGDDTTDEDAFKVVRRPEGWSIFVGEKKPSSAAQYHLPSVGEVEAFLDRLIHMK
jgi:trehalose 6-phosphate phosphatase